VGRWLFHWLKKAYDRKKNRGIVWEGKVWVKFRKKGSLILVGGKKRGVRIRGGSKLVMLGRLTVGVRKRAPWGCRSFL